MLPDRGGQRWDGLMLWSLLSPLPREVFEVTVSGSERGGPDLTGYGMSEFRDAPRMQFTLQASLSPLQDCIQAYTLRSQCSVDELRTLRSAS